MNKFIRLLLRFIIFVLGLTLVALGLNISKLSALGITAVSSIPAVISAIIPGVSLGNMVTVLYCVMVLVQLAVLRKKFGWKNIIGIPLAFIFGMLVDFVGISEYRLKFGTIDLGLPFELKGLLIDFPKPGSIPVAFVYLFASILFVALGVTLYTKTRLVQIPPDATASAISEVSSLSFGSSKTIVDVTIIVIALTLQIIFLGGFKTLMIGKGIVGIGTILSALLIGQIVKLISKPVSVLFKNL